ncbi:dynamin family protein, partial [Romboutsia sp.]|uniref:dynamin family protein n=1 Tax=Romboutsia sp. TaxID=1965302 RepID=UPI003F2CE3BD
MWLYKHCPNYKNVDKIIYEYFSKHKIHEDLILCDVEAYKNTQDEKYVYNVINSVSEMENISEQYLDKIILLLYLINDYVHINLWARLLEVTYEKINKRYLEKLLLNIDKTLKHTGLYTDELENEKNMVKVLSSIYIDMCKYKGKCDFIYKYEENITKYLLYASFQNKDYTYLYEAYFNLSAINKVYTPHINLSNVATVDAISEIGLSRVDRLYMQKKYPFEELLRNLNYILKDSLIYEEVEKSYLTKRATESKVMLYGMFSSGKSSFINSLLEKDVLKEGDLPTTSTFTLVGCEEDKELESKIKHSIPTSKVVVEHQFLKENNIMFIDTPGFEDLDSKQGQLSTDNANICDKFIVLLDATRPLTASEFNRIKKLTEEIPNIKLLFILNKVDYIDEEEDSIEEIVEDTRIKLSKILDRKKIHIYPYSCYLVKNGDEDMKKGLYNEILKLTETNKANLRLDNITQSIELSKSKLKEKIYKENKIHEDYICSLNQSMKNIENVIKLLAEKESEYTSYMEDCLDKFKLTVDDYIKESMINIFNQIPY